MTYKEMRALLRSNLDDLKGDVYADETLRLFLNAGMRQVWNELIKRGIYLSKQNITISFSNIQEVLIPNSKNIAKIVAVLDGAAVPIDIISQEHSIRSDKRTVYISRQVTSTGVPYGTVRNDFLGWYRIPNTAFDLTVIVCLKINLFQSGDADDITYTDIPEEHHDCIITFATMTALARLEEPADIWSQLYATQLENLLLAVKMENAEATAVADYADANQ